MPYPDSPLAHFKKAGEFRIVHLSAQVVGQCPCGSTEPIVLPVIPGAGAAGSCGTCGVVWFVEKIAYVELRPRSEHENPGPPQITIGVRGMMPRIVAPPRG
jgi:hypothetical protein